MYALDTNIYPYWGTDTIGTVHEGQISYCSHYFYTEDSLNTLSEVENV